MQGRVGALGGCISFRVAGTLRMKVEALRLGVRIEGSRVQD